MQGKSAYHAFGAGVSRAAGVKDVLTKCLRTNNPHNVVKATIDGLLNLRNGQQCLELRGKAPESKISA